MVATQERIASARKIVADYDSTADVLYLSLYPPEPGEGEDEPDGIVLRYGMTDDAPCGVTIVGYRSNNWPDATRRLAQIVGSHLSMDPRDALRLIEQTVKASK